MQALFQITLLVSDYDEALGFYVSKLGFKLIEDSRIDDQKRWVVVSPGSGCAILLAKAVGDQKASIGAQAGGRVGFFLGTDDFRLDYDRYRALGINFIREPIETEYGTVAVFEDLYGNQWDLIQHVVGHHFSLASDD